MALSLAGWSRSRQSKVKPIVKSNTDSLYPYCHRGSATVAELSKQGWK